MIERRGFLTGLVALVAAPAIVRFEMLMPVKTPPLMVHKYFYQWYADSKPIPGATNSYYAPTAADQKKTLSFRITGRWVEAGNDRTSDALTWPFLDSRSRGVDSCGNPVGEPIAGGIIVCV